MAIIKNRVARGWGRACVLVAVLVLQGCQPPGPRALLKGEALIRKGRYAEAIEQLQKATQLLPQLAQSWNHLGLAYHGNNQPQEALRAYQKALSLDHTLAAAHFNLGCLYLELNNLAPAMNELTAFTMIEGHSVEGWLKLGTAQLRAGRLDGAEKAFRTVLEIQAQHPEALNGLGVVKYQRRRNQEALDCFNAALAQRPTYAAALLNAAVVSHQTLNNRAAALDKYRQYLALNPRPPNWTTVEAAARQLESELNPPTPAAPARSLLTEVPSGRSPRSTPPATSTNPPVRPSTDRPGSVAASPAATGRPGVGAQPPTRPGVVATSSLPRAPVAPHVTVSSPAPILTRTTSVAVITVPVTNRPPDLEVTYLTEEPMIKPPSNGAAPIRSDPFPAASSTPDRTTSSAPGARRTFLDRINPFKSRVKNTPGGPAPTPLPDSASFGSTPTNAAAGEATPPPPPTAPMVVQRYAYLSPARPAAGDRTQATRLLLEGFQAQQAGKVPQALSQYKAAVEVDPGFFEACFNQGLAAYELGRWKESLGAYEHALAIKPDSVDARYNFALALKRANHLLDAAEELARVLQVKPDEVRAHYSLANLYAQQLGQASRAKPHYRKVIELDPRHPEASRIRYWLAQHP